MDRSGDVFGTLAWGLRRYAWLVLLATVAVGVLVPYVLNQSEDVFEAETTIQAAGNKALEIPSLDALPKFGEQSFNNGAVAQKIRDEFRLPASDPVIPERVELVTEQDAVGFTVIGRASNPNDAANLSNTAASTFAQEMNQSSGTVGFFATQEPADPPAVAEPKIAGGTLTLLLGVLAGLIIGVALVALVLVLRRPVLDAEAARDATGAPVLGRVTLPRGRREPSERDAHGLGALCRRLLGSGSPVILLVSPQKAAGVRHRLATVMASLLGRSRNVFVSSGGDGDLPMHWDLVTRRGNRKSRGVSAERTELVLVDGPTVEERTHRPDSATTLLVVREGITLNALRQVADEYLDGEPGGVVLVRTRRARRVRREPREQVDHSGSNGLHRSEGDSVGFFDDSDDDRSYEAESYRHP